MPDLQPHRGVGAGGATPAFLRLCLWLVCGGCHGQHARPLLAWRVLDPLPVLARHGEEAVDDDDDSPFWRTKLPRMTTIRRAC